MEIEITLDDEDLDCKEQVSDITDNEIESVNGFYSESYKKLMLLLKKNDAMRAFRFDKYSDAVSPVMHGYQFEISNWPVLISNDHLKEYQYFIKMLPSLYIKSLNAFGDKLNGIDFESFFALPQYYLDLYLRLNVQPDELYIRHDFVYSDKQMKLIESNVGSSLGGWQHDWLEPAFKSTLGPLEEQFGLRLIRKTVADAFFSFNTRLAKRVKPHRDEVNILFYYTDSSPEEQAMVEVVIEQMCEKIKPKDVSKVTTILFEDFNIFEFKSDGRMFYEGVEVDVMLVDDGLIPEQFSLRLYTSILSKNVIFFDGLLGSLIGNKAMSAVLHEERIASIFSPDEQEFISKYVPWTKIMTSGVVNWEGQSFKLTELLKEQKDAFVIKKTLSLQGADVFVGRSLTQSDWNDLVDEKVSTSEWVAQEFCAPDYIITTDSKGELKRFDAVWGIFDIGTQYGGACVRGQLIDGLNDKVINAAKGAVDFLVFEESD